MEFKVVLERLFARASAVLIESDWNLKWDNAGVWEEKKDSINRIRLEFKGRTDLRIVTGRTGINRIRLEFKDIHRPQVDREIESINRIRLEFKEW